MTTLEKCKHLKNIGFTYDRYTGLIYSHYNKLITRKEKEYLSIHFWIDKKSYRVSGHKFAWFYVYDNIVDIIDHINRNKSDNRIVNLRETTLVKNALNTKCKGYHFCKIRNNYFTSLQIFGKCYYLGRYKTKKEASSKYNKFKKLIFNLNNTDQVDEIYALLKNKNQNL